MSLHDTKNPNGGVPMELVIDQPTPEQHLLERILAIGPGVRSCFYAFWCITA